ncbi:MAG: LytTR family transcriptional regulator, partial [Rhizobiales bacterium]|nr:LytTR family transcriptional regulator [Hyphomicrobiales bacterium]
MPVTHEPWLVALSLIVAIQGAYVGLSLAVQVRHAVGPERRLLLAGAALSLGVAIWSMHFVGMLAARLPAAVDYLVFPSLLAFLVCVLVVGAAVFFASAGPLTAARLATGAVFMGLGIAAMHYIGMMALHASLGMSHDPALVAASVVVAIAASGLALHLANAADGRPPLLLSAAALGIAIAGMHYIAMAAVTLVPMVHGHGPVTAPAL